MARVKKSNRSGSPVSVFASYVACVFAYPCGQVQQVDLAQSKAHVRSAEPKQVQVSFYCRQRNYAVCDSAAIQRPCPALDCW